MKEPREGCRVRPEGGHAGWRPYPASCASISRSMLTSRKEGQALGNGASWLTAWTRTPVWSGRLTIEVLLRILASSPGVSRQGAEILLAARQRRNPMNLIQFILA